MLKKPSIKDTTINKGKATKITKNGRKVFLISISFSLTLSAYLSKTIQANQGAITILIRARDWYMKKVLKSGLTLSKKINGTLNNAIKRIPTCIKTFNRSKTACIFYSKGSFALTRFPRCFFITCPRPFVHLYC